MNSLQSNFFQKPLDTAYAESGTRALSVVPCPICAAPTVFWCRAADHHYGNSGMWDVYRCSHCGHLFQHPLAKEEDLVRFYPPSYYAYQQPITDFAPHGLRHRAVWLRLHYLKYFRGYRHLTVSRNAVLGCLGYILCHKPLHFDSPKFQPGGRFLDYGSGTGNTVAFAEYVGWKAEGIEIDPTAAKAGRNGGISVDQGSIETLESRPGHYDYIMSSHCVEHVPDVQRLFRAFLTALKPRGILAIEVPNGDSAALERFQEFFFYLGMPVHLHLFTPASISFLAKSSGFTDVTLAAYSRWHTQAQSAILAHRYKTRNSNHRQFGCLGPWRSLLGKIYSLSVYLRSLKALHGDCLVLTCVKPQGSSGKRDCMSDGAGAQASS